MLDQETERNGARVYDRARTSIPIAIFAQYLRDRACIAIDTSAHAQKESIYNS